jgi:hypothetical protein
MNEPIVEIWLPVWKPVLDQVVRVATRHALDAQQVLDEEGQVWKPMNSIQKWILPSRSSSMRPVSLGHQK